MQSFKSSYTKICSLSLSGATFRAAKKLVKFYERLASIYQQRNFLKRCRSFNVLPPHLQNMKLPSFLASPSNSSFKNKILHSLLSREIQHCFTRISCLRSSIDDLTTSLETDNKFSEIQSIASNSYKESKYSNKKRLIAKFNWNFQKQAPKENKQNPSPTKIQNLVTNYSDKELTADETLLLSKGPKFNVASKLTSKTELDFYCSLTDMAYQLRWKESNQYSNKNSEWNIPFDKRPSLPPKPTNTLAQRLSNCLADATILLEKEKQKRFISNISKNEYNALQNLKNDNNIYLPSDKGGEFTVLSKESYLHLGIDHLNDTTTYTQSKKDRTATIATQLKKLWFEIIHERRLPYQHAKRLIDQQCRTQQFYFLMKTHKEGQKIRPIVSASGGPFDRIGWLLQQILSPLLSQVAAHISSTDELIRELKEMGPNTLSSSSPYSFDVVSMYTNVDTNEAVEVAIDCLTTQKIPLYGLHRENIKELLTFVLNNNFFTFQNRFFLQHRGLAMGSRIAPILAILAVDKLERSTIFADLALNISFYKRYVDDSLLVLKNGAKAEDILSSLNSKHKSLKFELEGPSTDNSINILDTCITIAPSGELKIEFYEKAAKKPLFLHEKSAQPHATKAACARAEFIRARRICNNEHSLKEADLKITNKLLINGYSKDFIDKQKQATTRRKINSKENENISFIKFPFISDDFSFKLNRLLKRHKLPIRPVSASSNTLRQALSKHNITTNTCTKRNCRLNEPTMCHRKRVVYCLTCSVCQNKYVGSTKQPMHNRFEQHHTSSSSAVFSHIKSHGNTCAFSCKILASAHSIKELLFKEALLIREHKPKINRRNELDDVLGFLV